MPNGFTLASYQAALVTQIPSLVNDPNFVTILPAALDYAEVSIQRDLDLFGSHGLQDIGNLTIGIPTLLVPTTILVVEQMFYTPAAGSRMPLVPCTDVALSWIYGSAPPGPPEVWNFLPMTQATNSSGLIVQQIEVGPVPDQTYLLTAFATSRLASLAANPNGTYISLNMPDLLWAASMIFLAGYNRNFGAMADDPRQATSWTAEYQRLLKSAEVEEARKKFISQAWTAEYPAPLAQPVRK